MSETGYEIARAAGLGILLVPCTVTDIRKREIPTWYVLLFGALAVVCQLVAGMENVWEMLVGVLPGALFLVVSFLSKGKVGAGDGILLLAMGIFSGIGFTLTVTLYALISAAVIGGLILIIRRRPRNEQLPFVPFLTASAAAECILEAVLL